MAFSTNEGNGFYMPVAPAYGGGYGGGFGGFGGDWSGLIILFLICSMWGFGGFGGMGGMNGGLGIDFPWLMNGQSRITDNVNANTNAGFYQAATQSTINGIQNSITSGFGDVQLGIAGVNQAICSTGNGITAAVTGAQNALTQQMYSNQLADLERSYNAQTASTQGMNAIQGQLAQCCADNRFATNDVKYTIATEACNTRAANTANTQALLDSNQKLMDKLCQLELDNAKSQVAAEQRENANLRTELMYARGQASQIEQTSQIKDGQIASVNSLVNELRSCPIPAQPVYGSQPIFTCPNNGNYGCGCGM